MEPEEVKQDIEAARDEDSDTEAQVPTAYMYALPPRSMLGGHTRSARPSTVATPLPPSGVRLR